MSLPSLLSKHLTNCLTTYLPNSYCRWLGSSIDGELHPKLGVSTSTREPVYERVSLPCVNTTVPVGISTAWKRSVDSRMYCGNIMHGQMHRIGDRCNYHGERRSGYPDVTQKGK